MTPADALKNLGRGLVAHGTYVRGQQWKESVMRSLSGGPSSHDYLPPRTVPVWKLKALLVGDRCITAHDYENELLALVGEEERSS